MQKKSLIILIIERKKYDLKRLRQNEILPLYFLNKTSYFYQNSNNLCIEIEF